ncbi:type II toxin-antitoxin system death-on-curing family toxin [Ligilactobacillus apodemi]|uniref:type II toxin-antitoxin system death-on-curing family toxin n=1 Tax=Ligilactobacillus apodemi TaxID=307126 RepID=UPI00214AC3A6|nr:type II toxin-antitoxin system death-on-curing family toxin [Ligilactobacillus apodemi]MCR1900883.1 type II toxin-antitoxin system death-on-curing family toxin [Ligilactobacillus apodemi]
MEIDGVLFIPNFGVEDQQREFEEVFARSLNLDKVDRDVWEIKIDCFQKFYTVVLIFDGKNLGQWIVLDVDFQALSLKMLEKLNEEAEKLFNEEWFYGVKDRAALESLLARVDNEFFGFSPFPTTIKKAKVFWYDIATKQMFHNGNKRTALLSALVFLSLNGYSLEVDNAEELYNISMNLANKRMTQESLEEYLLKKVRIDFKQMEELAKANGIDKLL